MYSQNDVCLTYHYNYLANVIFSLSLFFLPLHVHSFVVIYFSVQYQPILENRYWIFICVGLFIHMVRSAPQYILELDLFSLSVDIRPPMCPQAISIHLSGNRISIEINYVHSIMVAGQFQNYGHDQSRNRQQSCKPSVHLD